MVVGTLRVDRHVGARRVEGEREAAGRRHGTALRFDLQAGELELEAQERHLFEVLLTALFGFEGEQAGAFFAVDPAAPEQHLAAGGVSFLLGQPAAAELAVAQGLAGALVVRLDGEDACHDAGGEGVLTFLLTPEGELVEPFEVAGCERLERLVDNLFDRRPPFDTGDLRGRKGEGAEALGDLDLAVGQGPHLAFERPSVLQVDDVAGRRTHQSDEQGGDEGGLDGSHGTLQRTRMVSP